MKIVCAAVVAIALATGGAAHADCHVETLAELPVVLDEAKALVSVKVNGVAERLIVDSGSATNLLTPQGAARGKVKLDPGPAEIEIFGTGGAVDVKIGTAAKFEMGNLAIPDLDFLVAGEVGEGADGLLGQSVLRVVDVEYDFAHRLIRLMKPKGCQQAELGYWAANQGVAVINLEPQDGLKPHAVGTAHVNGARIRVMLDTGAERSVLDRRAAAAAGITLDGDRVKPGGVMVGVDHRPDRTFIVPVDSFEVGGEQIKNTRLRVGQVKVVGLESADMLLGFDFFMSHRVYVANSQRKVYFTYAGGPVFDLSVTKTQGAEAASSEAHAQPAAAPAG